MALHRRTKLRLTAAATTLVAALGVSVSLPLATSAAPSLGQLGSELSQEHARQQGLAASINGLSQSIASLTGQIALVESREAAVRIQLARDEAALARAKRDLARERALLIVLRKRLARARVLLSRQLISSYEGDKPDLVGVVLNAQGFTDLLDRLTFLHDAERQQQTIIAVTREAKARADAAARRLARLKAADQRITDATRLESRALAGMNGLLHAKQGALQRARGAQQSALAASQARSGALQARITQIQQQAAARSAAAARAAATSAAASAASSSPGSAGSSAAPDGRSLGASGGWVIPGSIVQCESGGQNLPPNSAGASGYYQIMPATWKQYGGSGSAAYQASQAEQNAVASRIWAGGSGASNWVCAGIVGIH